MIDKSRRKRTSEHHILANPFNGHLTCGACQSTVSNAKGAPIMACRWVWPVREKRDESARTSCATNTRFSTLIFTPFQYDY